MHAFGRKYLIQLAIVLLFTTSLSAEENKSPLPLVPYPQTVTLRKGDFVPKKDFILKFAQSAAGIKQIADTCVQDLAALGFSASHGNAVSGEKPGVIELSIRNDELLGTEAGHLYDDR